MCLNNPIIEYLGTFIVLLKFWLHKNSISLNCFGEKRCLTSAVFWQDLKFANIKL